MSWGKYEKTEYKYVSKQTIKGKIKFRITLVNEKRKSYDSVIEAAKAVDLLLIKNGKEPVNILKRSK